MSNAPIQPNEFSLDMNAEVSSGHPQSARQVDVTTSTEIAAKIGELMRQSGIDSESNPLAAEKIQRDLNYQRQIEQLPQPESAPPLEVTSIVGVDRLEVLQKELDTAKAEATRWKREFGRREGKVGGMESRIKELEGRMSQVQPVIDVKAITGRQADENITAQDAVNLLMSQSGAFGNAIRQLREELMNQGNPSEPGLPLDMEAELVEAHPWLTDLPRPQKMRAMHDILSSAGVSIAPQAPGVAPTALRNQSSLPEAARAQVRQTAFIEPSNKGSYAEQNAIIPERQALNDKLTKLKEILHGPYKPGVSDKAAELLASLGAGIVDETQSGFLNRR